MKKNLTAIIIALFITSCSEKAERDESTTAKDILKEFYGPDYDNHVKRQEKEKIRFEKEVLSKIREEAKKEISEQNLLNSKETISRLFSNYQKALKERKMKDGLLSLYKIIFIINDPESKQYKTALKHSKMIERFLQIKLKRGNSGHSFQPSPDSNTFSIN